MFKAENLVLMKYKLKTNRNLQPFPIEEGLLFHFWQSSLLVIMIWIKIISFTLWDY
jgi:hypothetical protein